MYADPYYCMTKCSGWITAVEFPLITKPLKCTHIKHRWKADVQSISALMKGPIHF